MKRARIEIISDILLFIKKCGEARPTSIIYKTNLSVPLFNKYINALLKDLLISKIVDGKKVVYSLTEKGAGFVELLRELNSLTQFIEIYHEKRENV